MTEQLKTELLPCPFCGGEPKHSIWSDHNYHQAECEDCDFTFDYYRSFDELAAAWNRRASQAQEGFALVPMEPNERMGHHGYLAGARNSFAADAIYRAMIAAAPAGEETGES